MLSEQFQNLKKKQKKPTKNSRKSQNDRALSSLRTGTGGGIKLVLWAQIHLFYQFNLQL
jgi:hypothetical protein